MVLENLLIFFDNAILIDSFVFVVFDVVELRYLHEAEDWKVIDEQKMITSLPIRFISIIDSTIFDFIGVIQKNDVSFIFHFSNSKNTLKHDLLNSCFNKTIQTLQHQ
jgi:hypothetical protein